jgi:release factor glutamine methyltransferase
MPAPEPSSPPFGAVRLDSATAGALLDLGHALRAARASEWRAPLFTSGSMPRHDLEQRIGRDAVARLVAGALASNHDDWLQLAFLVKDLEDILVATPLIGWGGDVVYTGPDSRLLVQAVRRHARSGERAVELGTGSGLVAAAIAPTHRLTIATELFTSVAVAAQITFALNDRPAGHRVVAVVADVARGLRARSCDLVATNTPWLPAATFDRPTDRFRVGGESGVELPARFIREGAELLRPGGAAITLACDVEIDGRRPLREVCDELGAAGLDVALEPTGLEADDLPRLLHQRQPRITDAVHVAVVVRR